MRRSTIRLAIVPIVAVMLMPASLLQSAAASSDIDNSQSDVLLSDETPQVDARPLPPVRDAESREIEKLSNAEVNKMLREFENDTDSPSTGVDVEKFAAERGPGIRVKGYDSKIPTYDYYRVWLNKRATYLAGVGALGAAAMIGYLSGRIPNPYAAAAVGAVGVGSALFGLYAGDARNNRKCVAFSFYIRKKRYWGLNLPGREVAPRSLYQTNTNCTGRYAG